jgi:hypothetical protein
MPLKSKQLIAARSRFHINSLSPQVTFSLWQSILFDAPTPLSFNPQHSGRT